MPPALTVLSRAFFDLLLPEYKLLKFILKTGVPDYYREGISLPLTTVFNANPGPEVIPTGAPFLAG
jgi:hypothetical protein